MTDKERLEEIKHYFNEQRRTPMKIIPYDKIDYLIQQAERADKNKEELEVMDMQLYSTQQQVEKLKESLKESAIKFAESSERVQELEETNKKNYWIASDFKFENLKLEQQNKRYREAIDRALKEGVTIKDCDEAINHIYGILGEALEESE